MSMKINDKLEPSAARNSLKEFTATTNENANNSGTNMDRIGGGLGVVGRRESTASSLPAPGAPSSPYTYQRNGSIAAPMVNGNHTSGSSVYPPVVTAASGRRRASMFDPIDPTELQKTLYQTKSNKSPNYSNSSDASLGGNESLGTVEFGLQYVAEAQKLVVDLVRILDMQPITNDQPQPSPTPDIYCKCTLLPDKIARQTRLVKRSLNPVFEQQFEFESLDSAKMDGRFLEITLHESTPHNKDECIGLATLKLNLPNLETKNMFLRDFKPWTRNGEEENYFGDLMFSLAYLPGAERLTIVVMKARNLCGIGTDKKTPPDPYVKVSILSTEGSKKLKKKKTSTQKSTMSPVYNEEIVFTNIKKDRLADMQIVLGVYHDSLTHRDELGRVVLGAASKGNQYTQWRDMCDGKKSIAWWQSLQSTAERSSESGEPSPTTVCQQSKTNGGVNCKDHLSRSSINAKLRKFLARSTSINR